MSRRARVLLLEDDPQIRRFVSMVFSQVDADLVECARIAEAVLALEAAPVDVAICDLMLAGESGFDLIERIAATPAWRATRVLVFSAAIDAEDRLRMRTLGVWGQLPKPVGVAELVRTVADALAAAPAAAVSEPISAADEDAAVAGFFAGDRALFEAWRDAARAQFRLDIVQGDAACAGADAPALRRLAHSLKTVVGSLGAPALAARFAELEACAKAGDGPDMRRRWQALRPLLQGLADAG